MPKINILPKNVAELIAAGEVVERPASAIKELIENSIDAKSKKITVEIQNGGIRYIRITDDGCGISREDVPKAFISHATSKIADIGDLNSIYTLGFRGEALASIAAVAKVEMITKTEDEELGTRYCIQGGEEILIDDAGCPDGTTIVIRELFYNTPARMKFLKKDMTEGNYVSDVVSKMAVIHPEISFRFIKDGKQTLFTSGDGKPINAISAVMGKSFAENLIECDYELNYVTVKGFVSLPLACKATRNSQYFFINSRYVKIPLGASALDEAYKNSIMAGKFPYCILDIQIPPETVDVNVHPAKTEVRFSDEKRIFEAIYYAAKNAVTEKDIRPGFSFKNDPSHEIYTGTQTQMEIPSINDEPKAETKTDISAESSKADVVSTNSNRIDCSNVKVYTYDSADFSIACSPGSAADLRYNAEKNEESISDKNLDFTDIKADDGTETVSCADGNEQIPVPEDISEKNTAVPEPVFTYLGEAFKTYLFAEYEDKIIVIDKHALHERILFNEIKARGSCTFPQSLMFPVTVHLNRKEYAAIIDNPEAIEALGFKFEDFGEGAILVRECPMMFTDDNLEEVLSELCEAVAEHKKELITEKSDWLYHSAACRAAVKGGYNVNDGDAKALIKKVLTDDSVKYCPHGRPVLIELTRREIEKQFGRIQ